MLTPDARVMSPLPDPVLLVEMATLVPAFRAVWMVLTEICPVEADAIQGVPLLFRLVSVEPATMVMSVGSSSHSPALPEVLRA